jgi:hypothetical protein
MTRLIAAYFFFTKATCNEYRKAGGMGSVPVEGMKRKDPSLSACHDLSLFSRIFFSIALIQEIRDVNGVKSQVGIFKYS